MGRVFEPQGLEFQSLLYMCEICS